ncbi:MAG: GNAT family N-acetyltransferase [Defluviitaleaceae bacterium]|nr:GNAT family N-acetyltransferase [Defluviitaleaceae bacterium]
MMYKRYHDVREFYDAVYDLLMEDEANNLIPLGNVLIGVKGEDKFGWRDPANWFMATVSDDGGVQLVAIMTPPHNITLYAKDNKIDATAIGCLIDNSTDVPFPGVIALRNLSFTFAQAYCAKNGLQHETAMELRCFELTEVNPDIKQFGTLRLVNEGDMHFFPFWAEGMFAADVYGKTTMNIPQDYATYLHRINSRKVHVLEVDGQPVSIAAAHREMVTVCGIGLVYTPPYFTRRGYATSCVAQLSQNVLDRGFKKCVLYTDLANPTSNSIYQKIGYRPIGDSVNLKFV